MKTPKKRIVLSDGVVERKIEVKVVEATLELTPEEVATAVCAYVLSSSEFRADLPKSRLLDTVAREDVSTYGDYNGHIVTFRYEP